MQRVADDPLHPFECKGFRCHRNSARGLDPSLPSMRARRRAKLMQRNAGNECVVVRSFRVKTSTMGTTYECQEARVPATEEETTAKVTYAAAAAKKTTTARTAKKAAKKTAKKTAAKKAS